MAGVDARVDDGDDHARCTLGEVPGLGQVELAQAPLARPELVVRRRVERLEDRVALRSEHERRATQSTLDRIPPARWCVHDADADLRDRPREPCAEAP